MGVRNKLTDLNNHLFAEIERLGDEDLNKEELEEEIKRARAIVGVARAITANANTIKDAVKISLEYGNGIQEVMPTLLDEPKDHN